jgi:hypothetical protein
MGHRTKRTKKNSPNNPKEVGAVLKMVEHKVRRRPLHEDCRNYRLKGIPRMTDHCKMGPCRD